MDANWTNICSIRPVKKTEIFIYSWNQPCEEISENGHAEKLKIHSFEISKYYERMKQKTDKQILVIEDEEDIRESIVDVLKLEGYSVSSAENGVRGLEEISKKKPDLILCDIMMPDMDGFEVMKQVRQIFPLYEIPLVYITALSERKDFRQAMNLGAEDFITKPFTVDELITCVEVRLEKAKSIEYRITKELDNIEAEIQRQTDSILQKMKLQEKELAELSHEKGELELKLSLKENEFMDDALKMIDLSNTLQNLERTINSELERIDIKDREKKTLSLLKKRIRSRNNFYNSRSIFQMLFDRNYPHFSTRLTAIYPKISPTEITIACALANDLSTDNLANMLNILPESIRKTKYRLKQKLELNRDENLGEYLKQFKMESR